jgi:nicotinate-nucleotide adenylyltransferase
MSAQLGIFCGTFNPIHWGHLLMAEFSRRQLGLDKVFFITSPNPPHRHFDILDAQERFELVSAAVANNPHFEASRAELDRSGTSYTIDTVRTFHQQYPDAGLHLIIGEDNLQYMGKWKNAGEIFDMAQLVVAPRTKQIIKPTDPQEASALPKQTRVATLDLPHVNVSSSDIRQRLRQGRSVLYMVPPAVNHLLKEKRSYL